MAASKLDAVTDDALVRVSEPVAATEGTLGQVQQLAKLITRDCMIGAGLPRNPSEVQ